jgi:hypothetical protein|tara:strand:+ start:9320 stop:9547 length:228 start_codon:yes stop_codon:yes gene_type:complete
LKELVLMLCMLHGVVDSQNEDFTMVEVQPLVEGELSLSPLFIHVSNNNFSDSKSEGDEVQLTAFVDERYLQYCLN